MNGVSHLRLFFIQDDTSSVLADKCLKLLEHEDMEIGDEYGRKVFSARSKAIKGLVELVHGDMESGKDIIIGLLVSFELIFYTDWIFGCSQGLL